MIIKFASFQLARASMESSESVRDRALVHFPVQFRSIRDRTTARANYFNPSTNTTRMHSVPGQNLGQIVFEHVPLRDQVWASTRCVPTPQNTRCNRTASTGRIMVVGPVAEFGARAPIQDKGWSIVRSRQIYCAPWNVYCRPEYGLSPDSNISRLHSDFPSLASSSL